VDGCHKCQRVKTIRHKPYGLLKSLTVPDLPWTHLTMDFIDQLPLFNGFDTIFVVVCRLTKMAIFMNTTTKVMSPRTSSPIYSPRTSSPIYSTRVFQARTTKGYRLRSRKHMSRIHPVFHFAYQELAAPDTITGRRAPPPERIELERQNDEYEVSAILDSRRVSHKTIQYLVEWAGYQDDTKERQTWEPSQNVGSAQEMVDEFHT
jgi:hypothetical protein